MDLVAGTQTNVGAFYTLTIPGEGAVLFEAGRLVFAGEGEVAFVAGPHRPADESVEILCNALRWTSSPPTIRRRNDAAHGSDVTGAVRFPGASRAPYRLSFSSTTSNEGRPRARMRVLPSRDQAWR